MEGYGGGVEAPGFVIFGEVLGGFEDVAQGSQPIEGRLAIPVVLDEVGYCLEHVLLEEDFELLIAGH